MNAKLRIISSMLIFGSIGIFVKNIDLPSPVIALFRAVIGSLFLICAWLIMRQKISIKSIKKNLLMLSISGAALGLNWVLLFQAFKYTSISNATLSYYFAPIFVLMLSPIVLKEKLTTLKVGCIFLAMLGLFLILNVGGNGGGGSFSHMKGIIYGLLGATAYASVILMNKFIKGLSGFETTLIQLGAAAIVLFVSVIYEGNLSIAGIGSGAWFFIIVVGIIHTGVAYLMYFSSLKELNGQTIAIISYIDPISSVIFAVIFLGETMTLIQMLGGILILGSTFLSERLEVK